MQLDRLRQYAADLFGVTLNDTHLDQLSQFVDALLDWNANRANLTAITEPELVEVRHILDSLSLLLLDIPAGARVIDVGTGGGLPGMVLQIVRPDLLVTLLESVGKKTNFLQHISTQLGYSTTALHMRAEDAGQDQRYRERFDFVVARSVAYLPALLEYLLPLCAVGGQVVAMKGPSPRQEIDDATEAIQILGGELQDVLTVELPGVEQAHTLIVIEKIKRTPKSYPRRAGTPTKQPIGPSA